MTGTGSHVFSNEKPLASVKKRSWAQGGLKPLRNAGSKSKVQFLERGNPWSENKSKKLINHVYCYTFVYNN